MNTLVLKTQRASYVAQAEVPAAWLGALGFAPPANTDELTIPAATALYLEAIRHTGSYRAVVSRVGLYLTGPKADPEIRETEARRFTRARFRAWIRRLKAAHGHRLKPKTISNIVGDLRAVFAHLVDDDLLPANPCRVGKGDLDEPDHRWRERRRLFGDEPSRLISDERIPFRRRAIYAVLILGLRVGEAINLRVRDVTRDARPLWALEVTSSWDTHDQIERSTKTGAHRRHPVVGDVRAILEELLDRRWEEEIGRPPAEDDVLLTCRPQGVRGPRVRSIEPRRWRRDTLRKCFLRDLKRLGITDRRLSPKDLRRTFRSLATEAGVSAELRNRITHARPKDAPLLYDEHEWAKLCRAVMPIALPYHPPAEQLPLFGVRR